MYHTRCDIARHIRDMPIMPIMKKRLFLAFTLPETLTEQFSLYQQKLAKFEELKKLGAETVMSKVGRIGLRENVEKTHAILAGEVSCHFIFRENYNFDDGIYGGAKMAELVSFSKIPLSEMIESIPRYPSTPEMRIHCDDERKFSVVENVTKRLKAQYGEQLLTIDGAYLSLQEGWGSLRVSNTEPLLSMRFEGKTEKVLREIYSVFGKELATEGIKIPELVLQ